MIFLSKTWLELSLYLIFKKKSSARIIYWTVCEISYNISLPLFSACCKTSNIMCLGPGKNPAMTEAIWNFWKWDSLKANWLWYAAVGPCRKNLSFLKRSQDLRVSYYCVTQKVLDNSLRTYGLYIRCMIILIFTSGKLHTNCRFLHFCTPTVKL